MAISARPARQLVPLLALSACLVAGAVPAQERVTRLTCGAYEAVPGGTAPDGRPARLTVQKGGRLLFNVSAYSILRAECSDVDGDRTPELVVSSYTGGAHCCETIHAWALGPKPAKILEYEAGNAGGFEVRDLDGDGRQELVLGDDTFAYYGDLCYACSPSRLPMVACRTPRGFEDCTAKFPALARRVMESFSGRLRAPADADDVKVVEGAALGVLAASALLGEEDKALETIRAAVASDAVMKWLERARPQVRDWLAARGKRLKDGR